MLPPLAPGILLACGWNWFLIPSPNFGSFYIHFLLLALSFTASPGTFSEVSWARDSRHSSPSYKDERESTWLNHISVMVRRSWLPQVALKYIILSWYSYWKLQGDTLFVRMNGIQRVLLLILLLALDWLDWRRCFPWCGWCKCSLFQLSLVNLILNHQATHEHQSKHKRRCNSFIFIADSVMRVNQ